MRKYVLALSLVIGTFYINGRCRAEPKKEAQEGEVLYTETVKTKGYSYKSDLQRTGERIEVDLIIEKTTKGDELVSAVIKDIDIRCYTEQNGIKDEGVRSATFINTNVQNFSVNPDGTMDVDNKGVSNWDIDASYLISFYAIKKHGDNFHLTLMSSTSRMMFETSVNINDLERQVNEVDWYVNAAHYFGAKQFNKYLHKGIRFVEDVDNYKTAKMPVMFEMQNSPEEDEVKLVHPFIEAFGVITSRGVFKGLTTSSTMKSLVLSAYQEEDINNIGDDVKFGYHSNGGWKKNIEALENRMIGRDVRRYTTLWAELPKEQDYIAAPSQNAIAGATNDLAAQDSINTIAGATISTSRENAAYQDALVRAGLLSQGSIRKPMWMA